MFEGSTVRSRLVVTESLVSSIIIILVIVSGPAWGRSVRVSEAISGEEKTGW